MNTKRQPLQMIEADKTERFRASIEFLTALMKAEGCMTHAFSSQDLPFFQRLDENGRDLALHRIETMNSACLDTLQCGHRILENAALTKSFFEHAGLTSIEGLFESLQDDDYIEVFNTEHVSEFISAYTFGLVSYSIEELYCRIWTELLLRDVRGVHDSLVQLASEMLKGKHHQIVSTQYIPDHIVREADSKERRSVVLFPRFFAPVFREGKIAGYLCANKLFPYEEPAYIS